MIANDNEYDPSTISTDAHEVAFAIHNQGQVEHDFELIGPDGIVMHIPAIQAGITKSRSVELKPGQYRFICTVADHAQKGMIGTLTVR